MALGVCSFAAFAGDVQNLSCHERRMKQSPLYFIPLLAEDAFSSTFRKCLVCGGASDVLISRMAESVFSGARRARHFWELPWSQLHDLFAKERRKKLRVNNYTFWPNDKLQSLLH
jgi:hypothetical protein